MKASPMDTISIRTLLGQWYGHPLSRQEADELAALARWRLEKQARRGNTSFMAILLQIIADWWREGGDSTTLGRGMHYATSRRKLALYHLVAGQLLMSCKLRPALDYLDMGLRHADGLLSPKDYFTLYNRHEELRFLPLFTTRQRGYTLSALLNESRVMRKLAPHSGYSIPKHQNQS